MFISKITSAKFKNLDYESNQAIILINKDLEYLRDLVKVLISNFLEININETDKYPHIIRIEREVDKKSIGADTVKFLENKLALSVISKNPVSRIVTVEEGNLLTIAAQQTLLKIIEETPNGTLIIILTNDINSIIPTILSRTRNIEINKPTLKDALDYFKDYDNKEIEQNYIISDGNPKLLESLLNKDNNHINDQIIIAKKIISSEKIDRVALIDDLSKEKNNLINIINMVKQMANIGTNSSIASQRKRWLLILESSISLLDKINANAYIKLSLLDFMLSF